MAGLESLLETAVQEVDLEQPEWVRKRLGKNVIERSTQVGRDTMDYLESINMSQSEDKKRQFTGYMHNTGRQLMELQVYDTGQEDARRALLLKQLARAGRILRKVVKVSENEAGQSSVDIDKDWNTSSWTQEMIEAGIDTLIYVFLDDENPSNDSARKQQALVMLEKLLKRHSEAVAYVKQKIEDFMTRALNSQIRKGVALARLDLIYLVYASREKFMNDISMFSFCGRASELMMGEGRLAAIIIQHFFRTKNSVTRPSVKDKRPSVVDTFGSDEEVFEQRRRTAHLRSLDLRDLWRDMHKNMVRPQRQTVGGFRGPAYIPFTYVLLLLEIILTLVSKGAGKYTPSNREDLLLAQGSILLASFISSATGKFAYISLQILANVSKQSTSWRPLLESGCVAAALRFLTYLRDTGKLYWMAAGSDGLHLMRDKSAEEQMQYQVHKFAFFDCILFLTKMATHSAGVFRARGGYGFRTEARGDCEAANYAITLDESLGAMPGSVVLAILGSRKLMKFLIKLVEGNRHLPAMRSLLLCLFSAACCECHKSILFELVADSGCAARHVLELLNERDASISSLSLCLFVQMATLELGRDTFITSDIAPMLAQMTAPLGTNFKRRPYQRAVLITAAMMRQRDLRAYDPERLPAFLASAENVRRAVYLDLLKTMKAPPLEEADSLTVADLCVMPTEPEATLGMSRVAEDLNVRDIADFLVHPGDPKFINSLLWEEATGGCVILDGLTRSCGTAEHLISGPIILYLGQYMYISRYVLEQGKLTNREVLVLCNGLYSAAAALERICLVSTGRSTREKTFVETLYASPGIIEAMGYFVNTLSLDQALMDDTARAMLRDTGLALLDFLFRFAHLVLHMEADAELRTPRLLGLAGLGKITSGVIRHINVIYSGQSGLKHLVLDKACRFYAALLENERCNSDAVVNWGLLEALRVHLPPPLFGIGMPADEVYRASLKMLPASLVHLLTDICQADRGRGSCLADGFLRRCLDKLHVTHLLLESDEALAAWAQELKTRPPNRFAEVSEDHPSEARKTVCHCLRLLRRCFNFGSATYGSCNDLLLHGSYRVAQICRDIVAQSACPKTDPTYLAALTVLASLAGDMVRCDQILQEIDIIPLMRRQLEYVKELPAEGVESCLECLKAVSDGNPSEYKMTNLFQLREPLSRVAIEKPSFDKRIQQVSWSMFLSTEKAEHAASIREAEAEAARRGGRIGGPGSSIPADRPHSAAQWNGSNFNFDNDDRLSEMLQKIYLEAGLTEESDALSRGSSKQSSRQSSRGAAASRCTSRRGSFDHADGPASHDVPPVQGTYDACGVTHCGTLRLTGAGGGTPTHNGSEAHGAARHDPSLLHKVLRLPQFDASDSALAVSRLSAREPELRSLVLQRKQQSGFVAKIMSPIKQQQQQQLPIKGPSKHQQKGILKNKILTHPGSPGKSPMKLAPIASPGPVVSVDVELVPELLRTRPRPEEPLIFIC